ncbi:MAG: two-component regulator propeller domain-containing protein, partial [Verrucomicrobiota bacterium]
MAGLSWAQSPADIHWYLDYGGPSGDPFALAESGDHLYMAGGFLNVAGSGALKNLARFNLHTETWEQVPGIDASHANFIRALHADEDGRLWVSGDFSRIGGVEAHRVAEFDPATGIWRSLRDPVATVDPTGPVSGGADAVVRAGDYVYLGGAIFNSADARWRYIRRFNLKTRSWEAVGEGLNGRVRALAVMPDGTVLAGGAFNGGVARWDGARWAILGGGVNGMVRSLHVGASGNIHVGGDMSMAGSSPCSMVATWTGESWDTLAGGLAGGGTVNGVWSLCEDEVGRLVVAGDFDIAAEGGTRLNKVAFYDGEAWHAFGSGLGNTSSQIVNTVAAVGPDLFFGGVFADPAGSANAKKNFARW